MNNKDLIEMWEARKFQFWNDEVMLKLIDRTIKTLEKGIMKFTEDEDAICNSCDEITKVKWYKMSNTPFDIEDIAECEHCGALYSNTYLMEAEELRDVS